MLWQAVKFACTVKGCVDCLFPWEVSWQLQGSPCQGFHTLSQLGDVQFYSELLGRESFDFLGRSLPFPFIAFFFFFSWGIEGVKAGSLLFLVTRNTFSCSLYFGVPVCEESHLFVPFLVSLFRLLPLSCPHSCNFLCILPSDDSVCLS